MSWPATTSRARRTWACRSVAIGLFYNQGYFHQRLDRDLWQQEEYADADHETLPIAPALDATGQPVVVEINTRHSRLLARVWKAEVGRTTLLLLDADVDGNRMEDRELTSRLYGGDHRVRIRQELLLGVGGVRALAAMNIVPGVLHLNEGHSAFAALERARQLMEDEGLSFYEAQRQVALQTAFTTHTPVAAGHDRFTGEQIEEHLGPCAILWAFRYDELMALGPRDAARSLRAVLHDGPGAENVAASQCRFGRTWSRQPADVGRPLSRARHRRNPDWPHHQRRPCRHVAGWTDASLV